MITMALPIYLFSNLRTQEIFLFTYFSVLHRELIVAFNKLASLLPSRLKKAETSLNNKSEILRTVESLSKKAWGSLILIERSQSPIPFTTSHKDLVSDISNEILLSIFSGDSPIHDGAVLISGDKITSVSLVLPLSQKSIGNLGTRHRAGLGISEQCDCLVIITSERTGRISICQNGNLLEDITLNDLSNIL